MSLILLHICCAPCSIYPVSSLRGEGLTVHGFFYNPHIQPWQEFDRRRGALEDYARSEDLPLIVRPDYDPVTFFRQVAFRETSRCAYCYSLRLDAAARLAKKSRFDAFTSTLLYSRQQKHDLVVSLAQEVSRRRGIPFHYRDFRVGWKEGREKARDLGMYRQQYCGCVYSEMERFRGGKRPGKSQTAAPDRANAAGPEDAGPVGEPLPPCGISIDAEGDWRHGENRIVRPEILQSLFDRIDLGPDGGYTLAEQGRKCLLEVADAPFVVSRVDMENDRTLPGGRILLGLKHLEGKETLDPGSLWVGRDNVLYCRVRDGRFPARFSRPAYYQIAEFFAEGPGGEFFMEIDGKRYPVRQEIPPARED